MEEHRTVLKLFEPQGREECSLRGF